MWTPILHDAQTEDESLLRLACRITDAVGDLGIDVATYRVGPKAEGGWQLIAWRGDTERWVVTADTLYGAACELARAVGLDLE